jgi:hypothetical protein
MAVVIELRTATVESFAPFVGTEFSSEAVVFTLTEASPSRFRPHVPEARQPFRLTFTAPPPLQQQGTFTLTHSTLAPLEIFLVPVAQEADGFVYEAIFN